VFGGPRDEREGDAGDARGITGGPIRYWTGRMASAETGAANQGVDGRGPCLTSTDLSCPECARGWKCEIRYPEREATADRAP